MWANDADPDTHSALLRNVTHALRSLEQAKDGAMDVGSGGHDLGGEEAGWYEGEGVGKAGVDKEGEAAGPVQGVKLEGLRG